MCLLKKDMEVIKSAQLSYAIRPYSPKPSGTNRGQRHTEAEERAGGRPLCLESPLLCLRRAEYSR